MHVNIQSCDLVSWQQLQALMNAEATPASDQFSRVLQSTAALKASHKHCYSKKIY